MQNPSGAPILVVLGSVLALVGQFTPQLYPEVATCIFNKALNKLTIIHEMPAGYNRQRLRYRNVIHYRLSELKRIEVYRARIGLFRHNHSILIELNPSQSDVDVSEPVLVRIDGLHDQVLVQRGKTSAKLLAKDISYQLGQRITVNWKYIDIPQNNDWNHLGRRVTASNPMRRLPKLDIRRLAREIEQFVGSP